MLGKNLSKNIITKLLVLYTISMCAMASEPVTDLSSINYMNKIVYGAKTESDKSELYVVAVSLGKDSNAVTLTSTKKDAKFDLELKVADKPLFIVKIPFETTDGASDAVKALNDAADASDDHIKALKKVFDEKKPKSREKKEFEVKFAVLTGAAIQADYEFLSKDEITYLGVKLETGKLKLKIISDETKKGEGSTIESFDVTEPTGVSSFDDITAKDKEAFGKIFDAMGVSVASSPFYKQLWFIILAIAVVLVIIIAIIILVTRSNNK